MKPALPLSRRVRRGFALLAWLLAGAGFATAANHAAPLRTVFDGRDFFHRWVEHDQHEFTPAGQEDLTHWTDMITIVVHADVHDGDGLATLANAVLARYQRAGAVIVRTNSKPRTPQQPAEHLIVAVFAQPGQAEVAFARLKLVGGTGCSLVYSHHLYDEKIAAAVEKWLNAQGPALEKKWMQWDAFPLPATLARQK